MVNHVKLEIAIQLIAEKIADIYEKKKQANSPEELQIVEKKLEEAYDEKEHIAHGELKFINKIIKERGKK